MGREFRSCLESLFDFGLIVSRVACHRVGVRLQTVVIIDQHCGGEGISRAEGIDRFYQMTGLEPEVLSVIEVSALTTVRCYDILAAARVHPLTVRENLVFGCVVRE